MCLFGQGIVLAIIIFVTNDIKILHTHVQRDFELDITHPSKIFSKEKTANRIRRLHISLIYPPLFLSV